MNGRVTGWMAGAVVLVVLGATVYGQTFNDIAAGDWSTGGGAVWDQSGTPASGNPVVIDSHAITATNASHTYQAQSTTIIAPGSLTASRPLSSIGSISNSGTLNLQSGVGTLSLLGKEQSDDGDWVIGSGVTLQLNDTSTNFLHAGGFSGGGNITFSTGSTYTRTIGASNKPYNVSGTTTLPSLAYDGTLAFAGACTFGNLTFQNYSRGNVILPAGTHSVTGTLALGYTGIYGGGVTNTTLNVNNLVMANCWMSDARYFQNFIMNVTGARSYSSYMDRDNYFQCPVNLKSGAIFDHKWEFGGFGTGLIRGNGAWTVEAGAMLLKSTGVVVNGNGSTEVPGNYSSRMLNLVTNEGTVRVQFGTLSLEGNFRQTAGATTELKGGRLNLTGTANMDGGSLFFTVNSNNSSRIAAATLNLNGCTLALELASGFEPGPGDVFTNITATTLNGAFANVSNGQRLMMPDNSWFVVNVTTGSNGKVVLSNFGRPYGTVIQIR